MPAPLTEQRMKEIARVVATSPTMDGAATTLGYKDGGSLSRSIMAKPLLRQAVREARVRAGRKTWGVQSGPLARRV